MELAVDADLDHAAQIVFIVGVGAQEAHKLVKIMHMLLVVGQRPEIRRMDVPGSVHLKGAGDHMAVHIQEPVAPLLVDLVEGVVAGEHGGELLHDLTAVLPLGIHHKVFVLHR